MLSFWLSSCQIWMISSPMQHRWAAPRSEETGVFASTEGPAGKAFAALKPALWHDALLVFTPPGRQNGIPV